LQIKALDQKFAWKLAGILVAHYQVSMFETFLSPSLMLRTN